MSLRLKYVMVPTPLGDWPVLLPENICHSNAVNLREVKPVSAGFCSITRGMVQVEGESVSLGLASRPEDAGLIRDTLRLVGLL